MKAALKSEVRKLLSIRSTFYILGLALLLTFMFAFYVAGWKALPPQLMDHNWLASQVTSAVQPLSLLFGLVAILQVTHEYRHNTIVYTLTANRSRSKVLLAKFMVVSAFAILAALFFGFLSPLLTALGIHLHGLSLAPQHFAVWSLVWRAAFAGWGFTALAFILAVIIRVQVGAIVALFLIPSTVENLLGLVLKQKQIYLPFSTLNNLLDAVERGNHISYARSALVAAAYIVVGWIVAWVLFLKRDAN